MPEYRVKWEMDVEADTPQEAARVARDYQLNPDAIVGVFDVRDRRCKSSNEECCGARVDLDALDGRYADADADSGEDER